MLPLVLLYPAAASSPGDSTDSETDSETEDPRMEKVAYAKIPDYIKMIGGGCKPGKHLTVLPLETSRPHRGSARGRGGAGSTTCASQDEEEADDQKDHGDG